jgi:hypothetical protein
MSSEEDRKKMQLFLSIMDTVHDFSNKSRADKALKESLETNTKNVEIEDEDISKLLGSTAFLIDFIMLGYFHDKFRKIIGLDKNKNYIENEYNCKSIPYINSATRIQNTSRKTFTSNSVTEEICKDFYLPTYGKRILFRTEEPENIIKKVLFEYLSVNKKIYYNEDQIPINIDTKISNKASIILDLGNQSVEEKETNLEYIPDFKQEFKNSSKTNNWFIPDKCKYTNKTIKHNKGDLKPEYEIYKCEYVEQLDKESYKRRLENKLIIKQKELTNSHITGNKKEKNAIEKQINLLNEKLNKNYKEGVVIFKERQKSGVYKELDIKIQSEIIYNALRNFYNVEKITYITDENQMNNNWFKVFNSKSDSFEEDTWYKGKFIEYDSGSQTVEEYIKITNDRGKERRQLHPSLKTEFQTYILKKTENELLFFDELGCYSRGEEYNIGYKVNSKFEEIQLKQNKEDKKGLPLFMLFINEINKKTIEYKSLSSVPLKTKKELLDTTKNIALTAIEETYKLTVKFGQKDRTNIGDNSLIQLNPNEFILALFDLKRSMDYLFVKACTNANKDEDESHKYVFVSNDRSAVCYSLMQGNPTILTNKVASTENSKNIKKCNRGEHFITLYNPDSIPQNVRTSQIQGIAQNVRKSQIQGIAQNVRKSQIQGVPQNVNDEVDEEVEEDEGDTEEETKLKFLEKKGSIMSLFLTKLDNIKNKRIFDNRFLDTKISEFNNEKNSNITKDDFCYYLSIMSHSAYVSSIKNKIKDYDLYCSSLTGGQNNSSNISNSILDETIPIDERYLESICEIGSPMYILFQYYGQLNPTISFFWFITFKSLLYFSFGNDMDQTDCVKFAEMNKIETQPRPQQVQPNQSSAQQVRLQQVRSQQVQPNQSRVQVRLQQVQPNQSRVQVRLQQFQPNQSRVKQEKQNETIQNNTRLQRDQPNTATGGRKKKIK